MTPETIAHLSKIPNVCACKDAVNDVVHTVRVIELCGNDIAVSTAVEDHLLTMTLQFGQPLLLGATSVFLMKPACSTEFCWSRLRTACASGSSCFIWRSTT